MVRELKHEDLPKLQEIHEKFFSHEFSFNDFVSAWMFNFAITDENDEIISAGGVRPIAEVVAVTDFTKSTRKRRSALYDILQISQYVLRDTNYRQIHAFVQDKTWENHLIKAGFKHCVGNAVYFNLE
jgi:hypothetical protein